MRNAGSGSGFYLYDTTTNTANFVTASHVLVNPQNGQLFSDSIVLISYKKNSQLDTRDSFRISLLSALKAGYFKFDIQKDVAVLRFAKSKNGEILYASFLRKLTTTSTYLNQIRTTQITRIKDLDILSDIFIAGYPKSLALDANFDFSRPLIRKGIVSGIDLQKNKIIIDCASYQGNSGGGVFMINSKTGDISLIGVVSEFVAFIEHWYNESYQYTNVNVYNSGYSVIVPIDSIMDLMNSLTR